MALSGGARIGAGRGVRESQACSDTASLAQQNSKTHCMLARGCSSLITGAVIKIYVKCTSLYWFRYRKIELWL